MRSNFSLFTEMKNILKNGNLGSAKLFSALPLSAMYKIMFFLSLSMCCFRRSKVELNGTANERGTGLGLAFSRDFLTQNNGFLRIESKPGEGSNLIIKVPVGA